MSSTVFYKSNAWLAEIMMIFKNNHQEILDYRNYVKNPPLSLIDECKELCKECLTKKDQLLSRLLYDPEKVHVSKLYEDCFVKIQAIWTLRNEHMLLLSTLENYFVFIDHEIQQQNPMPISSSSDTESAFIKEKGILGGLKNLFLSCLSAYWTYEIVDLIDKYSNKMLTSVLELNATYDALDKKLRNIKQDIEKILQNKQLFEKYKVSQNLVIGTSEDSNENSIREKDSKIVLPIRSKQELLHDAQKFFEKGYPVICFYMMDLNRRFKEDDGSIEKNSEICKNVLIHLFQSVNESFHDLLSMPEGNIKKDCKKIIKENLKKKVVSDIEQFFFEVAADIDGELDKFIGWSYELRKQRMILRTDFEGNKIIPKIQDTTGQTTVYIIPSKSDIPRIFTKKIIDDCRSNPGNNGPDDDVDMKDMEADNSKNEKKVQLQNKENPTKQSRKDNDMVPALENKNIASPEIINHKNLFTNDTSLMKITKNLDFFETFGKEVNGSSFRYYQAIVFLTQDFDKVLESILVQLKEHVKKEDVSTTLIIAQTIVTAGQEFLQSHDPYDANKYLAGHLAKTIHSNFGVKPEISDEPLKSFVWAFEWLKKNNLQFVVELESSLEETIGNNQKLIICIVRATDGQKQTQNTQRVPQNSNFGSNYKNSNETQSKQQEIQFLQQLEEKDKRISDLIYQLKESTLASNKVTEEKTREINKNLSANRDLAELTAKFNEQQTALDQLSKQLRNELKKNDLLKSWGMFSLKSEIYNKMKSKFENFFQNDFSDLVNEISQNLPRTEDKESMYFSVSELFFSKTEKELSTEIFTLDNRMIFLETTDDLDNHKQELELQIIEDLRIICKRSLSKNVKNIVKEFVNIYFDLKMNNLSIIFPCGTDKFNPMFEQTSGQKIEVKYTKIPGLFDGDFQALSYRVVSKADVETKLVKTASYKAEE